MVSNMLYFNDEGPQRILVLPTNKLYMYVSVVSAFKTLQPQIPQLILVGLYNIATYGLT